jgi:ParB family chromosome partitioning protein
MVSRYLRIDVLIDELKYRIDNDEIPLTSGVDLSFLKENEQEIIESIINDYGFKVDLKKSETLKTFSQGRNFNYDKAYEVLSGKYFDKPKKNKKPKFTSKFTKNIVERYVTEDRNIREIENLIEQLLKQHFSQSHEMENSEELEMK